MAAPRQLGQHQTRVRIVPEICFVPIWYPIDDYATSRLRGKYVVELFAGDRFWDVKAGYHPGADIAVIVQLCSDRNYRMISYNRDQLVIYDICDRYFATDNTFRTDEGLLSARGRCLEMIERADMLIAPTRQLRDEIARRFPGKPCFHVPELVDYGASPHPVSEVGSRRLLWFGHTTRGNFESAQWIIDHLRSHYGYQPVLVTSERAITKRYPAYAEYCVPWSPDAIRQELARAELCVVSHAEEEPSKSPNRFVTATIHGVPTLVSGSPSCIEILDAAGYGAFAIDTPLDVRRAIEMLSNRAQRTAYVSDLQKEMWRRHAPEVVRHEYMEIMQKLLLVPDSDDNANS